MKSALLRALDVRAELGRPVQLWWRDDDAVAPTVSLDRLLDLSRTYSVPITLAVIPEPTGAALADRLAGLVGISVAVHGWSHRNHAPAGEKKQELGAHRPVDIVLEELGHGFDKLHGLHGDRFVPVLVPPWNRMAGCNVPGLPALGFQAISLFGAAAPSRLRRINTHVDLMDWHGTGGCRPPDALFGDLAGVVERPDSDAIGLLTHHLVHDGQAWSFLAALFDLTCAHPGCDWVGLNDLLLTNL